MTNVDNYTVAKSIITNALIDYGVWVNKPPAYHDLLGTVEALLNSGQTDRAYREVDEYAAEMAAAGY